MLTGACKQDYHAYRLLQARLSCLQTPVSKIIMLTDPSISMIGVAKSISMIRGSRKVSDFIQTGPSPMGIPKAQRRRRFRRRPSGRFLNILYLYGGHASLRGGAGILDSVVLCVSSRPPTRETQFRAHFLMIQSHKSHMFLKPGTWGSERTGSWDPKLQASKT